MKRDRISILYVEDEVGIRESLSKTLNYLVDEVILASDGEEGLALYIKHRPDIVLSDIKMPNMSGIEMVKAIKEIDNRQNIIFTSAHSESSFFIDAINLQVDGYILKPIDLEKLEKKIDDIKEIIELRLNFEKQQISLIESEKMVAMGEMIGNIAHQWRQPLNILSAINTSLVLKYKRDKLTPDDIEKFSIDTNKVIQNMSNTIDDFRNFIKGEKIKQKFSLRLVLESTLNIIESNIKSEHISLIKDIDKKIILYSYPNELAHALINIFNNAKDALITQKDKYIFLSMDRSETHAIIKIRDNGGGIEDSIIHKIYEPYFTTKHKSKGTGLGLYMSFTIITNSLKGSIEASRVHYQYNNIDYIGSEFTIKLPLK